MVEMKLGATVQLSRPTPLFQAPFASRPTIFVNQYATTSDGRQFVVDSIEGKAKERPLTVMVNWPALLKP